LSKTETGNGCIDPRLCRATMCVISSADRHPAFRIFVGRFRAASRSYIWRRRLHNLVHGLFRAAQHQNDDMDLYGDLCRDVFACRNVGTAVFLHARNVSDSSQIHRGIAWLPRRQCFWRGAGASYHDLAARAFAEFLADSIVRDLVSPASSLLCLFGRRDGAQRPKGRRSRRVAHVTAQSAIYPEAPAMSGNECSQISCGYLVMKDGPLFPISTISPIPEAPSS